jgi:hypothetical protein
VHGEVDQPGVLPPVLHPLDRGLPACEEPLSTTQ